MASLEAVEQALKATEQALERRYETLPA